MENDNLYYRLNKKEEDLIRKLNRDLQKRNDQLFMAMAITIVVLSATCLWLVLG